MSFEKFKGCGEEAGESKKMGESNELSKEPLGFSLYIFYDACDVKIKSDPSPQRLTEHRTDVRQEAAHLAGEGFFLVPSRKTHPVLYLHFLFRPGSNILI